MFCASYLHDIVTWRLFFAIDQLWGVDNHLLIDLNKLMIWQKVLNFKASEKNIEPCFMLLLECLLGAGILCRCTTVRKSWFTKHLPGKSSYYRLPRYDFLNPHVRPEKKLHLIKLGFIYCQDYFKETLIFCIHESALECLAVR